VNLLSVAAPQQVLLEVKVAEVSKTLLDKLGVSLNLNRTSGDWTFSILADLLSGGASLIDVFNRITGEYVTLDGEKKDGLIKILAEPNLMAISGQEGSCLAGGTVYFPIAESGGVNGATTITLQAQDFGVSLRFTPTVLEAGRINLKVTPEVSELATEGVAIQAFNTAGRSIAPVINRRRASTTVQLYDGQTFVIGGLIRNNAGADIKAFPLLGEIPVLGALFRSTAWQTNKSELLFVVTPRLAKPITGPVRLPTDSYIEPSRIDLFLGGKLEGTPPPATPAPLPPPDASAPPAPGGFQLK
jgi:pilus assembly protein CpaC